jgi:hypothetical protein
MAFKSGTGGQAIGSRAVRRRVSFSPAGRSPYSGAARIFPSVGKLCSAGRWSVVQGSAQPTAKRLGLAAAVDVPPIGAAVPSVAAA